MTEQKDMNKAKVTRRGRAESGAAAVEFALVIIVLLLIVAGIVEFGRAFWYYDALTKATRDGARFLTTAPKATISSVAVPAAQVLVTNAANAANVSPVLTSDNVSVTCLNAAFQTVGCENGVAPEYVRVAITSYSVTIGGLIPFILPTGATPWITTLSPYTTMRYMLR